MCFHQPLLCEYSEEDATRLCYQECQPNTVMESLQDRLTLGRLTALSRLYMAVLRAAQRHRRGHAMVYLTTAQMAISPPWNPPYAWECWRIKAVLRDCCAQAFHTAVLGKAFQNLECFVESLGFLEWNQVTQGPVKSAFIQKICSHHLSSHLFICTFYLPIFQPRPSV